MRVYKISSFLTQIVAGMSPH